MRSKGFNKDNEVQTGLSSNEFQPKEVKLNTVRQGTGASTEYRLRAFLGSNLGHRTLVACMPLSDFYDHSLVANRETLGEDGLIAQRPLDMNHARKMALYMLKGIVEAAIQEEKNKEGNTDHFVKEAWNVIHSELGEQPYAGLQPIVVNIRECEINGDDLNVIEGVDCWTILLSQAHKLWVIDGQHRRKGMEMLFTFLDEIRSRSTYPKRGLFSPSRVTNDNNAVTIDEMALWETCWSIAQQRLTIAVEVHLGLKTEQERQLFHDLNRLVKKIDVSMALDFDTSNPINLFTKDTLVTTLGLHVSDNEIKDWNNDDGSISRKDVTAVNARLFMNKGNINGATGSTLTAGQAVATRFWTEVLAIPGFGERNAHKKTVAAQPVVLKALAKLVYDYSLHRRKPKDADEILEKILSSIKLIDFSHHNPMWRYYEMSEDERTQNNLSGLSDYLPKEETGNRDIGGYQEGENVFRFGSKHNDIYPIISDMIRWKLGLPSRTK